MQGLGFHSQYHTFKKKKKNQSSFFPYFYFLHFKFIFKNYLCGWVCYLVCVPNNLRDQKRMSHSLELEQQVVVNCGVGAGNQHKSSGRTASAVTTESSLWPLVCMSVCV